MKRNSCLKIGVLLLLTFLFAGCNQIQSNTDQPQGTPSEIEDSSNGSFSSQTEEQPTTATKEVTIVSTDDTTPIAVGSSAGDLYFLPANDVQILDSENRELSASDLTPGMKLIITYNGEIQESYPASFCEVSTMKVTQVGSDLVGLYYHMISDITSQDTALDADTSIIALDLTQADNLTAGDKSALSYLVTCGLKKECYLYTYEELVEEGLIDDENLYFKDGVLITIAVTKETKNSFEFSISKWRSGLGAIGYDNCTAKRKGTEWNYEFNDAWIS